MGDRVLFQVVSPDHARRSPVVYGHCAGDRAPAICEALTKLMATRPGDVDYTAARLVQLVCNANDAGMEPGSHYLALSVGIWNAPELLSADASHGDAGCVLIITEPAGLRFVCFGGYLVAMEQGTRVAVPDNGEAS